MFSARRRGRLWGRLMPEGGRPAATRLHPRVTPGLRRAVDVGWTLIAPPFLERSVDRHWYKACIRSSSVLTDCKQGKKALTAAAV